MVRQIVIDALTQKSTDQIITEVSGATEEELKTAIAMCELTKRSKKRTQIMKKELKFREKEEKNVSWTPE